VRVRNVVEALLVLCIAVSCGSSGSGGPASSNGGDTGDSGGSGRGAGTAGSAAQCTPGSTQTCVGPGACHGGQACLATGSGWAACDCGAVGGNSGVGGSFAAGGSGASGATSSGAGRGGSSSAGGSSGGSSTQSDKGSAHWLLDGSEVASGSLDFASGTNMAWNAASVAIGVNPSLGVGTYPCSEYPARGLTFHGDVIDQSGNDFSKVPTAWHGLVVVGCKPYMASDTATSWIRVDRADTRVVGAFEMTITGAETRAGHTLVIRGDFDVDRG